MIIANALNERAAWNAAINSAFAKLISTCYNLVGLIFVPKHF